MKISPLAVAGLLSLPLLSLSTAIHAATYTVGPGKQYAQLSSVFTSNNLQPGDVVLVDGGTSYNGGVVIGEDDSGSDSAPVTIRWNRAVGATRPVIQGGANTIKLQRSNNVVLEGLDVRGGTNTCIFNEAHRVVVRDSIIRNCPSHGILGADNNSGSFTLEYSEVSNSGNGTLRHPIYMQSDEVAYPDSVFLMRFNYIHSGTGGNLVKSRHQRTLIYNNWLEGATYQAIELIGPDCETQQSGWSAGMKREDADIVGNVIVQSSSWRNAIRVGGDLNGRSQGRVRIANNTIMFNRAGASTAVLVQLGLESLEMHNNVIYQPASGSAPEIVKENPASSVETPVCAPTSREPWVAGRKVSGSNNWVQSSATLVPSEWTQTLRSVDPQLTNAAQLALRPRSGSPLISAANTAPTSPFPFPSPLLVPVYDPPQRAKLALGDEHARIVGARMEIGAFEDSDIDEVIEPTFRNGSRPLLPSTAPTQVAPAPTTSAAPLSSQPAQAAPEAAQPVERPAAGVQAQPDVREQAWWSAWVTRLWSWVLDLLA